MSQYEKAGEIRNVAVIAHVDHGKTTLVDALLRETGAFGEKRLHPERVMDSTALERERGITILAKNTSVRYRGTKINIVDTPGHADFGGEVERILGMVDGALLLVDALDGPMPQTRFVVQKALEHRLKLVLVINKIDRRDARVGEIYEEVFDLLIDLGAGDDDVDFPVVYTDARAGFATTDLETALSYTVSGDRSSFRFTISPVLDAIIDHVPAPSCDAESPLRMMVSTLSYDDYIGRIAIGRVESGALRKGRHIALCRLDGQVTPGQISGLWVFRGLERMEVSEARAGDIAAVSGIDDVSIGETIADPIYPEPLPPIKVDEPTMMVTFRVNDSPFAGKSGVYLTSRHLRERLYREARKDPSLKVEATANPDEFEVSGRGELHLGILIETMRREGYEMGISKPEVILKGAGARKLEPYEILSLDIPEEYMGRVMEELGPRRAEVAEMHPDTSGRVRLTFRAPTRGLMGFRPVFLTITKGTGIMHRVFDSYGEYSGEIHSRREGAMISWETGTTTTYALHNAQERGILFVGPGEEVYGGQIVGQNSRNRDLDINVCKKKHLTNMRASTAEETLRLTPKRVMSLEDAIQWIREDELVEVTPDALRLRKIILDRNERHRASKDRGQEPDEEA